MSLGDDRRPPRWKAASWHIRHTFQCGGIPYTSSYSLSTQHLPSASLPPTTLRPQTKRAPVRSRGGGAGKGNDITIIGPLHWPCLYGQAESFQLFTLWICEKINPEHLFKGGMQLLLQCSTQRSSMLLPTRHRIGAALQTVGSIVAMLQDDIQYNEPRSEVRKSHTGASRDAAEGT